MKKEEPVVIFELDKPNLNGRIYTTECMEKAINKLDGKPVLGTIGMVYDDNVLTMMSMVSHSISNLRIEDGKVVGNLTILDTPEGRKLTDLIEEDKQEFVYRSSGIGNIEYQEDGTRMVTDFQILSINAVNPDTAS